MPVGASVGGALRYHPAQFGPSPTDDRLGFGLYPHWYRAAACTRSPRASDEARRSEKVRQEVAAALPNHGVKLRVRGPVLALGHVPCVPAGQICRIESRPD